MISDSQSDVMRIGNCSNTPAVAVATQTSVASRVHVQTRRDPSAALRGGHRRTYNQLPLSMPPRQLPLEVAARQQRAAGRNCSRPMAPLGRSGQMWGWACGGRRRRRCPFILSGRWLRRCACGRPSRAPRREHRAVRRNGGAAELT